MAKLLTEEDKQELKARLKAVFHVAIKAFMEERRVVCAELSDVARLAERADVDLHAERIAHGVTYAFNELRVSESHEAIHEARVGESVPKDH